MTLIPWGPLAVGATVLTLLFGAGLGVPRHRPSGAKGTMVRWGHGAVWALLTVLFCALAVGDAAASLVPPLGLAALAT